MNAIPQVELHGLLRLAPAAGPRDELELTAAPIASPDVVMVASGMKSDAATTAIGTTLDDVHDVEHSRMRGRSNAATGVIFS